VEPTAVEVIEKVPVGMDGAHAGGHYMTMTSCHPKWSNKQRIIVWLELVDEQPHSSGMPLALRKAQEGE
ncbi:MAG: class E sortase, partial [Micrococcales bacterium]